LEQLAKIETGIWIKTITKKIEKYVTARDGVRLFTSIYLPKDTLEKHPILLTRTPYSCAPYGEANFRDYWNIFYKEYFKEKYIVVLQDVRGRWMSEGTFVDVRPFNPAKAGNNDIDETTDTYDAIDWLVKNVPANNGKGRGVWYFLSRLLLYYGLH
jgi:predicted acyl esterase